MAYLAKRNSEKRSRKNKIGDIFYAEKNSYEDSSSNSMRVDRP